jgi:hypothetical protein
MASEKDEADALAYMTGAKVDAAEDDSEEAEVSEAGFLFCGAGLLHVDQNKRVPRVMRTSYIMAMHHRALCDTPQCLPIPSLCIKSSDHHRCIKGLDTLGAFRVESVVAVFFV